MQGLLTNDVTLLERPNPSPLYSCILNAQGRYLHDLFLHPLSSLAATGAEGKQGSPTVLLDIDSYGKNDLLRLLKRYRLREKIEIDDVSEDWQVWTRFPGQEEEEEEEKRETNSSQQFLQNGNLQKIVPSSWPADPRLPSLGFRTLFPTTSTTHSTNSPPVEVLRNYEKTVPWEVYRRYRISLGVAEGDQEIPSGEAIALEYNIDQGGLHGISFSKGCYIGQELMARTHFKGVVRKRIVPVRLLLDRGDGGGEAMPVMKQSPESSLRQSSSTISNENIVDKESGKVVGSLRVVDIDSRQGLALLRLQAAQEAIDGRHVLKTESSGVEIMPRRPAWWPNTWGREQ
jgi:folate-binding protein YgfZ